jgi:hypothetical protein
MDQRSLTLYDVIVDIIPGIITLSVIWTLYPSLFQYSFHTGVLASAIGILAFSYVIGRLIHGVSGWTPVERGAANVIGIFPGTKTSKPYRNFEDRIQAVLTTNKSDSDSEADQTAPLETKLSKQALDQIGSEFDISLQERVKDSPDSFENEGLPVDDETYTRYIADSRLYPLGELSWKYSLLATFFRNMWLILAIAAVLYLSVILQISVAGGLDILPIARSTGEYILLCLATSVGALISLKERFKFKRRQIRTLVIELYFSD